ncbi:MAG: D-lyxose/D-mannose family sugar isomerase [Oscillospiraceae bacterium]
MRLTPGESIFIYQRLYHDFTVGGRVPATCCSARSASATTTIRTTASTPPMGRFPEIEEDEPPYRLLCSEYPAAK